MFIKLYNFFKKNFFLRDKVVLINLIISFTILLALLGLFIYKTPLYRSEKQLFLHYNIYFGIDWVGQWYKIFIYPLLGALIFIVNLALGILFYNKEKVITYFLLFSATFCEIIILIASLSVVWINS
ncbi:hypothetical protein ACFL23_01255 [Patescibacteria group bacterium]